jgi:hypothetical protein
MGNSMSGEGDDDKSFLEKDFDLDSPDADQKINYGTAAPNWQPKHTVEAERREASVVDDITSGTSACLIDPKEPQTKLVSEGQEVATMESPEHLADPNAQQPLSPKHGRSNSNGSAHGGKRPHGENNAPAAKSELTPAQLQQQQAQNAAKKLSYIQMAKLGYQELVNAIIRPPRADYKVSRTDDSA